MRKYYLLPALTVILGWMLAGCEKDTVTNDKYADWQTRNSVLLDSVVRVARQAHDGEWTVYPDYRVRMDEGMSFNPGRTDSVYVRWLNTRSTDAYGKDFPAFTDSVRVFYRGYLVDNTCFDSNFTLPLRTDLHNPSTFALSGVVPGWASALMHMREGMEAEVYLPYQQAYGSSASGSIPAYSVLKFHIYLEKIIHPSK